MADISDVTRRVAELAEAACYPAGKTQPSVTGRTIDITEGWPQPEKVNKAVELGATLVTVFPPQTATSPAVQVWETPTLLVPPVHGLTVAQSGASLAVSGTPGSAEYLTVIVDGQRAYSVTGAQGGGTAAGVAAALATSIAVDYPGTAAAGGNLTIAGPHTVVARIGAPGRLGENLHRERAQIQICVWAPNHADRSKVAAAIDVALKRAFRLALSDQSQAILTYDHTATIDDEQASGIYRRDLFYMAEYATVGEFDAFEVTAVELTTEPESGTARSVIY